MIRAHANHGFVRRDDLAAVITATIAALEAVEDVEDVDIATLATWTPINRDGSRTTMWTPAEFGENLAIVTKNRRLAEYAARVEPWFRTNFEADEGGQALLALSADEQRALRTSEVHGSDAYRWALVAVRKYYGNFPGLSDTKPAPTLDDLIHAAAEQSARNEEAQRHGN
jgi:hypothetical protein